MDMLSALPIEIAALIFGAGKRADVLGLRLLRTLKIW
jgi:hypothetical protein